MSFRSNVLIRRITLNNSLHAFLSPKSKELRRKLFCFFVTFVHKKFSLFIHDMQNIALSNPHAFQNIINTMSTSVADVPPYKRPRYTIDDSIPENGRSTCTVGTQTVSMLTTDAVSKRESAVASIGGGCPYAIATMDSTFKHLLSGNEQSVIHSFFKSFIPDFGQQGDELIELAPTAIPALRDVGQKQVFMDLHFVSSTGVHYVVEMQRKRHVCFDERVLFYTCATYSTQLTQSQFASRDWYTKLKPIVGLQFLNFDTNRAAGISSGNVPDTLPARVRANPLAPDQFRKEFVLKDRVSGQEVDALRLVQVELPRSELGRKLFPPEPSFTMTEWWLSVLQHSQEYSCVDVERLHSEGHMPPEIYSALKRLDKREWNYAHVSEYEGDLDAHNKEFAFGGGHENYSVRLFREMLSRGVSLETISMALDTPVEILKSWI